MQDIHIDCQGNEKRGDEELVTSRISTVDWTPWEDDRLNKTRKEEEGTED